MTREGFAVDTAADGALGLHYARNNPYDIVILDWMLPKLDGIGVLHGLQNSPDRPHVIVLTARDSIEDRVAGLNAGGDDYLVKPFSFDELLARVHALVRRRYSGAGTEVEVGALKLDTTARRAELDGKLLDLTFREYALLEYLAVRQGHTVTREEVEDHIYGVHKLPSSNAVDSAICILRSKLGPEGKGLIRTKRGQGYVLGQN
ncbi:UNVERIFIED_CONTAM: hypothetical protein GTU68_044072 [Idotea baltica]|nr:hypothetical protein [Idotea baltica]